MVRSLPNLKTQGAAGDGRSRQQSQPATVAAGNEQLATESRTRLPISPKPNNYQHRAAAPYNLIGITYRPTPNPSEQIGAYQRFSQR